MKKIISILFVFLFIHSLALKAEVPVRKEEDIVKKSSSGICHDKTSKFYEKTKKFKSFKTIKECLDSGGRLPKK